MSPFIAELIGTMLLILMGNGVVANVALSKTYGNNGGFLLVTLAWGFAVFIGVVVAGPYSGAHLNPAVTIGLTMVGKFAVEEGVIAWSLVSSYILAQMLGAALGAFLVWLTYRDHYYQTEDEGSKLATFCTTPAINNPIGNLITEMIGTFVLIFGVLFLVSPEFNANIIANEIVGLGSIGALPVALIVVAIGMSLGGPTGYAINPARDLAPRIMHAILPMGKKGSSNWSYAWVPIVGPIIGAAIAAGLYLAL
jgi:glycerol uptake facilitator